MVGWANVYKRNSASEKALPDLKKLEAEETEEEFEPKISMNEPREALKHPSMVKSLQKPSEIHATGADRVSGAIEDEVQGSQKDQSEMEIEQSGSNDPAGMEEEQGEETTGIFAPAIDLILWKKAAAEKNAKGETQYEYLVKYKDYSYLHLDWLLESEIMSIGKTVRNKLNRFNRMFATKYAVHPLEHLPSSLFLYTAWYLH